MKTDAIEDAFCRVETGDTVQARLQLSALLEANREMREALKEHARWQIFTGPQRHYVPFKTRAEAEELNAKFHMGHEVRPLNDAAGLLERLEKAEASTASTPSESPR